ncbi:hypothetical protein NQ315_009360, partial [Exocentrus adspersus]
IFKFQVLLSCLVASSLSAEESKAQDDRGKRNLEYQVSHPYAGPPSHGLERRISLGSQHPLYPPPPFYPGPPRPYSPYRKGRPQSYPVPPYAVQMEPLVHYSQRDPLYDTNSFSLNADPHNDLAGDDPLTESNHIHENSHPGYQGYGPHKPHIIERPVYIKEPEPIIEIIIKESNVSLPAPPPPPPPPKKKKEQVQVFYVKYKKNPHGVGKDSIIYDKPVPAISPKLPEDDEEEEEETPYSYHHESATAPPPPTTTLRTIIKPDSEVYHSPSGVKVTFGKEGFDYSKRSSKAQDYNPSQPTSHLPQGRQLSSFTNTYFNKRPYTNQNSQAPPPSFRAPQPYRPFVFPPQPPTNYKSGGRQSPPQFPPPQQKFHFQPPPFAKPTSQQYSSIPSSRHHPQPAPQFSHTVSHPAPPTFQNPRPQARQPVPYKPFEYLRPQQSFPQSSPQQHHLPPNQASHHTSSNSKIPPQQPSLPPPSHLNPNPQAPHIHFRPETHFPVHQQLPLQEQSHIFNPSYNQQEQLPQTRQQPQHVQVPQQQNQPQEQTQYQHEVSHTQFNSQQQEIHQQPQQHQTQHQTLVPQNEHLNNLQTAQSILPPGGQLIQSVPRYEQHISEIHPINRQENLQNLSPQEFQHKIFQQFNSNNGAAGSTQQNSQEEQSQQNIQQQIEQQRKQQEHQLKSAQQYYRDDGQSQTTPRVAQQSTRRVHYVSSTPKISYQSTTSRPSTTTQEPDKPSTTTKDPKVLEAQLPDEVPEELREQLLSSGILNHADISVLDYDKIGDIPLSALPPDQLANFYSAGGGAQIAAGSEPVPKVVRTDGSKIELQSQSTAEEDQEQEPSETHEVRAVYQPAVEMKVVKYDPETDKGQQVQGDYVKEGAQRVEPVVLNDETYNRYLPLKVNGTQFPIPDVPELKGKKISSVVVLAPVSYDFSPKRNTRETSDKSSDVDLIQGDTLKQLLANPNKENYRKFLESENKTSSDKQAVILLIADPQENDAKEKEIYMYDVATQTVSKLSGELSSAFVEAAEANSDGKNEDTAGDASNVEETRVSLNVDRADTDTTDLALEESASGIVEAKIPIIDLSKDQEDMETDASEQLASFVDVAGMPISSKEDLAMSGSEFYSNSQDVLISSSYSKTDHS